jgi:hypothetical protein
MEIRASVTCTRESKFTHTSIVMCASDTLDTRCGGVIGLYFLVKRCCLLYLHAGHGTFALAPYLDIHGEVDTSMR